MLFEMQDLKGCLLPCSILPQTAPVKSGISGSVVTLKDNLKRYELLSHTCFILESYLASSKNKWEAVWFLYAYGFFISWDFKSVSCPFYLLNLLFPSTKLFLKIIDLASQFLHWTFSLLMNCEIIWVSFSLSIASPFCTSLCCVTHLFFPKDLEIKPCYWEEKK